MENLSSPSAPRRRVKRRRPTSSVGIDYYLKRGRSLFLEGIGSIPLRSGHPVPLDRYRMDTSHVGKRQPDSHCLTLTRCPLGYRIHLGRMHPLSPLFFLFTLFELSNRFPLLTSTVHILFLPHDPHIPLVFLYHFTPL